MAKTTLHDDLSDSEPLELDLTRPALQQPALELDLVIVHSSTNSLRTDDLTDHPVLDPTVRPELVEGHVHSSTGSLRTESMPVRPELVEGQEWKQATASEVFGEIAPTLPRQSVETQNLASLPSMEEFAVAKLAEQYNYKGNLTIGALEDEIVFRVRRSASDVLEAGKALIILKEIAGHGNFNKRLELLGFKERTARNYMRVAEKFGKSASNAVLVNKVGEYQKMLELTFFNDEELEALATGGDVDGIDLEKIKELSAPKLKALIKSRVDNEKKPLKEEVAALNKKIENHEKAYAQLEAAKEVADSKLNQLTTKKKLGNDLVSPETAMFREESFAFEYGARVYLDAQKRLLEKAIAEPAPNNEELLLRINSIAIAASATLAQADELFRFCQDALGTNDMPPILNSRHVLTPEERERLEDAITVIEHKFNLEADSREFKREQENKKPAGRPLGASNKTK